MWEPQFYKDVEKNWATAPSRVVGHVAFSPPFRLGAGTTEEEYTQDYAIIKVDKKKIDRAEFKGNLLDLENKIPFEKFNKMMNPSKRTAQPFEAKTDDYII